MVGIMVDSMIMLTIPRTMLMEWNIALNANIRANPGMYNGVRPAGYLKYWASLTTLPEWHGGISVAATTPQSTTIASMTTNRNHAR